MSDKYREIDGSNNNELNPENGKAGENFIRKTPSDYGDEIYTMAGGDRPSPREISNTMMSQEGDMYNSKLASNFLWAWGQFLDHDITLTREAHDPEHADISIPQGDPYFDPFYTGSQTMEFKRSGYDENTGIETPREQVNDITAFIDASNVYGSSEERADWLRAGDGTGKLKLSEDGFLPYNDGTQDNAGGPDTSLFVAGDVRGNENVLLTSLHTIFVREHNRLVDELAQKHPEWDGDTLYEEAKLIVEAQMQSITYNEYLPMLLGENAIQDYTGYDEDVSAQISNVFATAAFRLGHTQLSSKLSRVDEWGGESEKGHMALKDAFFQPDKMAYEGGPGELFRGAAETYAQEIDLHLIDDVRNFLFGPPGAGGFDLASLNIQRGRDHGLPDYNTAREAFGLVKYTTFAQITSDVDVQQKLYDLYEGDINNIDIFVGGLAEDAVGGSMLGELFQTILVDQFTRLRDGDSYFYESRLTPEQLAYVEGSTLSEIIKRNTDVEYLQKNVFEAYDRIGGTDGYDDIHGGHYNDLIIAKKGHDEVFGKGGNDDIYGGEGDDWIDGGKGNDNLYGEGGDDEMVGGKGDDHLHGGTGNDWMDGGKGNDHMDGGEGHDELEGGAGDDTMKGGSGSDELWGGSGNDKMHGGDDDDWLDGGTGNDHMYGDDGDDGLEGGKGHDHLHGGEGNDWLGGGKGNDKLYGEEGHDDLEGGHGHDHLYGGKGDDWLSGGSGKDHLYGEEGHDDLEGGHGHDHLYGGTGDDWLSGGSGKDHLYGGEGHDDLEGGDGKDHLYGGTGDDWLSGGSGKDHLYGGYGHDELEGGYGKDYLKGGEGHDQLWGGSGADTFVFDLKMGVDKLAYLAGHDHDTMYDFNRHEGDTVEFHGVEDWNDDGEVNWDDIFDQADIYTHDNHTTIEFHGGGVIEVYGDIKPSEDSTVIV